MPYLKLKGTVYAADLAAGYAAFLSQLRQMALEVWIVAQNCVTALFTDVPTWALHHRSEVIRLQHAIRATHNLRHD